MLALKRHWAYERRVIGTEGSRKLLDDLESTQVLKVCPQCDTVFASDNMFCSKDGAKLEFAAPPPTEDDADLAKRSQDALPSLFEADEEYITESKEPINQILVDDDKEKPSPDKLIGSLIDKHYEIMQRLGSGGMSVVYLAKDIRLKKIVALKMMLPHLVANPMSLQRFQQEAEAASNLSHPNVIGVHNFGITKSNQPYLVMDYCHGTSLADLISSKGPLVLTRAVPIFIQIAGALAHAHEKGVIHRDLKPSNILLTDNGDQHDVVKIVDFGIAKLLPQEGREAAQLTQTGEVFGSPLYMSPEQCRGERLDVRSDVYQMGCLMYESLAGHPPLDGENMLEILFRHINEMPQTLTQSTGTPVPPKLEAIVFKTLAKDPGDRYQSMSALRDDLIRFQRGSSSSIFDLLAKIELIWHKRRVWKRSEIIAASILALFLVIALSLAYQLISVYGSAHSLARRPVEWKENLLMDAPPKAPPDANTVNLILERTDKTEAVNKGQPEDERQEDLQHELRNLQKAAADFSRDECWSEAAQIYGRALKLNKDNALNPESSGPVRMIIQNLATCYLHSKQYKLAQEQFEYLIKQDLAAKQIYGSVLAEAFAGKADACYFQEFWQDAANAYRQAGSIWQLHSSAREPTIENIDWPLWYLPIKNKTVLVAAGRFADCHRKLAESNSAYYGSAARLYHQCAISWQSLPDEATLDYGVSLFYFAQMAEHISNDELAHLQLNDDPSHTNNHMTVDDLYKKSVSVLRSKTVDQPFILAGVLKGYANYQLSHFDLLHGLANQWEALQILYQAR